MDIQRGLLLNWTFLHQQKCSDEVRQSVLLAMELEDTRIRAQNELKLRDEEIVKLKGMLRSAVNERNEAQEKYRKLLAEKKLIQRHSGISSIEDDSGNGGFVHSSSDGDESIVSSPAVEEEPAEELPMAVEGRLPVKGKFLEAVVRAGPLLQTLLLSGSLPQWRHPPPPLEAYQLIPPPPFF